MANKNNKKTETPKEEAFKEEVIETANTEAEEESEKVKEEPKAVNDDIPRDNKGRPKRLLNIPYIEGEDPEFTGGVNGVMFKIQKGVDVMVTEAQYQVYQNSKRAEDEARKNRERLKNQVFNQ